MHASLHKGTPAAAGIGVLAAVLGLVLVVPAARPARVAPSPCGAAGRADGVVRSVGDGWLRFARSIEWTPVPRAAPADITAVLDARTRRTAPLAAGENVTVDTSCEHGELRADSVLVLNPD